MNSSSRAWRSIVALGIFALEVFLLRRWFTTDYLLGLESWWAQLLVLTRFGMPFSLCVLAGMAAASGRRLLSFYQVLDGSRGDSPTRIAWLWLPIHGLAFGACFGTASYLFQEQPTEAAWLGVSALGFGLSLAALVVSLIGLVVSVRGFLHFLWDQRLRLPIGSLSGGLTYVVGERVLGDMPFWRPMGAGTMWLAYHFLGLIYPERILEPRRLLIGTPEFEVFISRYCSGYEGVLLFIGFFSLFLYLSRERLRFPQVFWLLPLGITCVYLLNGLRIAILIVVGTELSGELAMEGFHVNAGWPFFGITAWLAVLVAVRSSVFSNAELQPVEAHQQATVNLYGVYLAPLVISIGAVMLSASVTTLSWVGDVVKLIGVGLVLWIYRHEYRHLLERPTSWALGFGILGVAAWSLFHDGQPTSRWELSVILPRLVGFVLIAPLAEELAFRGFLMRRLSGADFEAQDVRSIGPWPVLGSALVFAALHEQWLAALASGIMFGLAYRIRGRLADAFVAHVLANSSLVVWALLSGDWGRVS